MLISRGWNSNGNPLVGLNPLPAVGKTLLALFHIERAFINVSIFRYFKTIVFHLLTKVDGHMSHVDGDKYPEHSWII
jgi:hypothetical protein